MTKYDVLYCIISTNLKLNFINCAREIENNDTGTIWKIFHSSKTLWSIEVKNAIRMEIVITVVSYLITDELIHLIKTK